MTAALMSVILLRFLLKKLAIKKLQETFTHSLDGLKVVDYYGCLLVRPPEVTNFDDPENPTIMDNLNNHHGWRKH